MSAFRERYPDLMEKYLPVIRGGLFFGFPVNDLDREELLVMAAMGWSPTRPPVYKRESLCDSQPIGTGVK